MKTATKRSAEWQVGSRSFRLVEDRVTETTQEPVRVAEIERVVTGAHVVRGNLIATMFARPTIIMPRNFSFSDELVMSFALDLDMGTHQGPSITLDRKFESPEEIGLWLEHDETITSLERLVFYGQVRRDRTLLRTMLLVAEEIRTRKMPILPSYAVPARILRAAGLLSQ